MSGPFIGQIAAVGFNFAPVGWALCNGALLSITENPVLYTLIGAKYGGDGVQTFALPDLQGRVPVHQGTGPGLSNYAFGKSGGVEGVTLSAAQMPAHTHAMMASTQAGTTNTPGGTLALGTAETPIPIYASAGSSPTTLAPAAVAMAGSSAPHDNLQPYVGITYIIALEGIYPSQN
jgi:microcystin-dependent protein